MLFKRLVLLGLSSGAIAAHADGDLETTYGEGGRNVTGFLESSSLQLRAIARSPSDRTWMFADDVNDRGGLYVARVLANGQPDPAFGGGDGRTRSSVPAALIPQTEALSVEGALVQADGKPLLFGGLRAVNGETGAFPGVACRLAVAGNFDAGFGAGGCTTLRSFLDDDESCLVTDVALDADDKLVVVGNCGGGALGERPFIARLTDSGALDAEFGAGAGLLTPLIPQASMAGQYFRAVAVQPDGLIVVLGHFRTTAGNLDDLDLGVLRFDNGGTLDNTFSDDGVALVGIGGDTDDYARDLVLRPDGRVLALGQRARRDPLREVAVLVQFEADGSFDDSFGTTGNGLLIDDYGNQLGGGSMLRSLDLDVAGRIVIAGTSTSVPSESPVLGRAGTDFRVAFPPTVPPAVQPKLFITADTATSGHVSNAANDLQIPFVATPGLTTIVEIPVTFELDDGNDLIEARALHVTSQAPVAINTFSGRSFNSNDGSLLLPSQALGTEYRLMSWGFGLSYGSTLLVVASLPDTQVTITPKVTAGARQAGVPFAITLQPGEAYRLTAAPQEDLSGSLIVADRPVAVFGSHGCAQIPDATVEFCDFVVEQMLPVSSWGQSFHTLPLADRVTGDLIRVYAHQNGTQVSLDGALAAVIPAGTFYQTIRTTATHITANVPVSVAQYSKGCKAEPQPTEFCIGDPLMLTVLPASQWVSRYNAVVPQRSEPFTHYIAIVAPLSAVENVYIDGQPVAPASFTAIGATGFAGARVPTETGTHQVTAPEPIGVSVYGFGNAEGYGYPATASSAGEDADADDVIVRHAPNGIRDPDFGTGGIAMIDHRAAYDTSLPSFDSARRALVVDGSILVGTASSNGLTAQSFLVSYRLEGGLIFRDGFED